tara:strand:- start:9977 stop:10348 length:372 start_codon:yes stop_codon:yes gene_type:complete
MTEDSKNKKLDENINKLLKKWVHYDESIKKLENELSRIKEKKKVITPLIENEFKNNNINKIIINKDYNISLKNKEYYSPVNRKYISKSLDNLIDDPEKKNKIIEYIYNNREIIYRNNLLILPN